MAQSKSSKLHVAIIMDGNGRWAETRGLPRLAGHNAGAGSVRRTVEACPELGIGLLTLYTFSSDNWQRSTAEVDGLMRLLEEYLELERDECLMNGVRVRIIGRRDRLPASVRAAIDRTERETAAGRELEVRLAVDYSSRDAILTAAASGHVSRESIERALAPSVDLLIRTGGERRLSDFLLWECAYAELYFTPCMWPDFGRDELAAALEDFRCRDRRYGAAESPRPSTPTPAMVGDTMQFL